MPLADKEALLADGDLQILVLRWVDIVDAAGEHGDGAALKRGLMGCGVDATGKTRGNDEAFAAKLDREGTGKFLSDGGAIPRADHGNEGTCGELEPAFDIKQGRRRIDFRKGVRIARLADADEGGAQPIG